MADNMLTVLDAETYPKEIRPIVEVLIANEERLSDGYGYYCGDTPQEVRHTLTEIATEILNAVK